MNHLGSHIKNPELRSDNTLHVIGVISNPVRWHSRYRLFHEWAKHLSLTPHVQLHVVESVYKDRHQECNPRGDLNYNYMAVQVQSEIWLKENLINIGIRSLLPKNWKYVAWVDCDVSFGNDNWALASIHQLQHYNIIQPWQSACDLDFHGNVMNTWRSFGSLVASGKAMCHDKTKEHLGYSYAHTGYAWACNRYFYENVQKLADFNIVGAGDHLMAWACLDEVNRTMPNKISQDYRNACQAWANKASRACGKLVGFTPGRLEHHWHGSKVKRQYWSRWDILTKNDYEPSRDLGYDSQGVIILVGNNKYKIEHEIMRYNRARCEDSIES